jgi:cytochrome c553
MRTPSRAQLARFIVERPWTTLVTFAAVATTLAAAVIVSGVVSITASSGHWTITARILDFAKVRAVATQSLGIQAPSLDDETLLLRGASHYENACSLCHGRPGESPPPMMAAMTPPPPRLTDRLARYSREELFFIVKHGIKFTGMPAWPVEQREDEVWAVVSFLQRMPGLDIMEYFRLASGEPDLALEATSDLPMAGAQPPPRAVRDLCWRCHGVDGTGRGPGAFPSLAGQGAEYLSESLQAYAARRRFSGIMTNIAARLSAETMREVAQYYAGLPARAGGAQADASAIARGAALATSGDQQRDIPACAECHGPSDLPKNPAYPRLSGQHLHYLTLQLGLLKERRRGGSPNVALMHVFVGRLDADDIRSAALYYSSGAP